MSDTVDAEKGQQEIDFGEVVFFLKTYWKKIVFFFALTFLGAAFLIAAGYFLLPRKELYTTSISIQLRKIDGWPVYPSERRFSANDIISTAVLRRVYERNNLNGKISFKDFTRHFSLFGSDIKKGMLLAAYQSKFAKKNISLAELKRLEEEYEEALRKLDHDVVGIAAASSLKLGPQEVTKLLREVPVAWFDVYSTLESKVLPQMESAAQIRELRSSSSIDGWLITLDRARIVCGRLMDACQVLDQMLMGQRAVLPTGEGLADLLLRMRDLELRRIRPLLMFVSEKAAGKEVSWNAAFLRSSVLELEQRISMLKGKCDGAAEAINILHSGSSLNADKVRSSQAGQSAPLALNLDGNSFASLSALIRSSQSIPLRSKYAEKAFQFKENISELEAAKSHYEYMLRELDRQKAGSGSLSTEQFDKLTNAMFDELLLLCGKANTFREMILKDFLSSRQFFATTGEVQKISSFCFPFKYVVTCLIFLLIAANAVYIGIRFYAAYSSGEFKR